MALAGCYTRLTTPKEAIFYTNPKGDLIGSRVATVIFADVYNEAIRGIGVDVAEAYLLQPNTLISVEVYGQSISQTVTIRPDGIIDLPLIGEVKAEGRTVTDVKDEISRRYAPYYVLAPQVIVNTSFTEQDPKIRAGEVSILNPTGSQGVFTLTGDEYLSQALADLEALHPKSEWNEIAVIREGKKTKERYIIVCDVEKLVRLGDLDQDIKLRNGDIVFVPYERNTLLEEVLASFRVLAGFIQNIDTVTSYIERVEGY
ncbi:MAG: polysaccharide biosynthesis/export family protein [Planctomycetota bacterium]